MIDLEAVRTQVVQLDLDQVRARGLVVLYDDRAGMPGAAEVRRIVNLIVAEHPRGSELFECELHAEPDVLTNGMTFLVDIPGVRLIPASSIEAAEALAECSGALVDLRNARP